MWFTWFLMSEIHKLLTVFLFLYITLSHAHTFPPSLFCSLPLPHESIKIYLCLPGETVCMRISRCIHLFYDLQKKLILTNATNIKLGREMKEMYNQVKKKKKECCDRINLVFRCWIFGDLNSVIIFYWCLWCTVSGTGYWSLLNVRK